MNDVGIMHDLRTIYFTTYYYLDFFVRTALCVFIVLRKGGGVEGGGKFNPNHSGQLFA